MERPDGHKRQISLPGVTPRRADYRTDDMDVASKDRSFNSVTDNLTDDVKGD
jgi:hypothetical protein